MIIDSRQKRSRLGYQRFLFSILCTLFFLSLYLLGSHYIPAPELYLKQLGWVGGRKLFSSLLDHQIQVNFTISLLSAFFTIILNTFWRKQETEERQKLANVWSTLSKFLKPNLIAFNKVLSHWHLIKNSRYLIFLTYLSFFASNSVFELIIESLNDYGVCGGFELIFFIDKFPFRLLWELLSSLFKTVLFTGSHSDLGKAFSLLSISFITYLFVSMLGKRWEIPINTNRVGFSENHINYSPAFFLQMNFGVFPLIFISNLVRTCGVFWDFLLKSSEGGARFSFTERLPILFQDWKSFGKFSMNSSSFKEVFFAINNTTNPFSNFYQRGRKNINFFPAIICWVFTIHFVNWLVISNSQLNSQEISEKLEKSGTYLDGTRPGGETRKLVGRVINMLVILWALHLTFLTMCFDNIVPSLVNNNGLGRSPLWEYNGLPFFSLLITVSTATNLSKQIRKKYDHCKFYD